MDANMAYGNDTLPKNGDLPSTSVPRLGVPQFIWMGQGNVYRGASNGCILGCCTACPTSDPKNSQEGACCTDGYATQIPQGSGVAATFNQELIFNLGVMISDESWGIQNGYPGTRIVDYRTGASSVINIGRDGRWGRMPEEYSECPMLTAATAVALNKGLTGYLSLNATTRQYGEYKKLLPVIRHFVAYAGPDSGRFNFNAIVSEDDLELTYLPAWKRLVDADAIGGVMSAISACNSIPSAAHKSILTGKLRNEWNFTGYVISDCDTMAAVSTNFHYTASVEQATVVALQAGGDINCGPEYELLLNATNDGILSEINDINPAVLRVLMARIQVGDLDPNGTFPYLSIPYSVVNSLPHQQLARQVVRESIVLLKNDGNALPFKIPTLNKDTPNVPPFQLVVIGPSADDQSIQAHTYHGTPMEWVTVLAGLKNVSNTSNLNVNITYVYGCSRTSGDKSGFPAALAAAATADAILYVGGLEAGIEEEDTDRSDFQLYGVQLDMIQALYNVSVSTETQIPMAVLIISGGPVSEPWIARNATGLSWLWLSYFGQAGEGVADVLLGNYSPSGRLPHTMPVDTSQIGDITDYDMRGPPYGRTYRYLQYSTPAAIPLFPFGYGLSYSNITYVSISSTATYGTLFSSNIPVTVSLMNTGPMVADYVVAIYGEFLTCSGGSSPVPALPLRTLLTYTKVQNIPVSTTAVINTTLTVDLTLLPGINRQIAPGILRMWVGDGGVCSNCPTFNLPMVLGTKACPSTMDRDEL